MAFPNTTALFPLVPAPIGATLTAAQIADLALRQNAQTTQNAETANLIPNTQLFKSEKTVLAGNHLFGEGSLASSLVPNGSGNIDVVRDYEWTVTQSKLIRNQAPKIILKEYRVDEGLLVRQATFYAQSALVATQAAFGREEMLKVYEGLYPKDKPTGWRYQFPYLSDVNFELSTSDWTQMGAISEQIKQLAGGVGDMAGYGSKIASIASFTEASVDLINAAGEAGAQFQYSVTGINDRPRMFSNHGTRTVTVKFYLYNTTKPGEWEKNRQLLYLLVNQNLYNKRDFATGAPPVFYEVLVPGQYFSIASSVTNIRVTNEGNMRELKQSTGNSAVVPDAYGIEISLTEMAMPSQNQFQALENGMAQSKVSYQQRV